MGDVIDYSELIKTRENRAVNCETLLMLAYAAPSPFIFEMKTSTTGRCTADVNINRVTQII